MSHSEMTFDIGFQSMQADRAHQPRFDFLNPIRQKLDAIPIRDRKLAHLICKLIPAQCPFERDINLFGRTVAHIPPMCKLNPLYDQFVGLRFRSLCYLVDECGEAI
jgi:Mo-dependent nitrogenase C-terminus